jgi:NADH-quinone oxidoreductase subunit H
LIKPRRRVVHAVARAPVLLALALACLFVAGRPCPRDVEGEPVQVHEIVPHEVEVGDRIAILGAGFAPGKPARVSFRGTLHRPGEQAIRDVELVTSAKVLGPGRVEFAFDEATQSLFSGAGDRALHTTFTGEVEVAFAAETPGAAPIAGVLKHQTLDVRPGTSAFLSEHEREGEHLLEWIGVSAATRGGGLVVEAVAVGSRAQAAGIVEGDVLTACDGVRVMSAADVVPPPGEREATIDVRNGLTASESERLVALDGFRRSAPAELIGPAMIALIALGVVLLFGAPTGSTFAARLQRVVSRLRERVGSARPLPAGTARQRARSPAGGALLRALTNVGRATLPTHASPAVADLVACALVVAMPFGQYVIAARLDVGLLFAAAATSLATAAYMVSPSAWRGMRAAAYVALQHLPAAAAVASVVITTGSLRIQEIERAQGGWPWEWLAFRSPAALVALGMLLASTQIQPEGVRGAGHPDISRLVEDAGGPGEPRGPWLRAAYRAHHIAIAGLASTLFLGGWHLPGLSAVEQAGPTLELAGAAWLLGKTWAVVVMMALIGWSLPQWNPEASTRSNWLWLGPLVLGVLMATEAWTWWSPGPAAQLLVSLSLVAAAGLAGVAIAHRLRHGLTSAAGDGRVSGFI